MTRKLVPLVLLALLVPVASSEPTTVVVTLLIDATQYPHVPAASVVRCDVEVPAGADGKAMLTQATLDRCIAGWTATYFVGQGFFVDAIDGRRAVCDTPAWLVHCTFWALSVDGAASPTGVDGWTAAEGDVYGFTYTRVYTVADELP